jgi:hypothetical protein
MIFIIKNIIKNINNNMPSLRDLLLNEFVNRAFVNKSKE